MPSDPGELLFCYGTLQRADVQIAELGRELMGSTDQLHGFRAVRLPITDPQEAQRNGAPFYLALVPGAGEAISGMVYTVSPEELELADRYEAEDYIRQRVLLASGREAWVYLAAPGVTMEV